MEEYTIRAHHGMCIAFFRGKGYSEEFTAHMRQTIADLQQNPTVCVVAETDYVCQKCPHDRGGVCKDKALVEGYDNAVLQACGLAANTRLPFQRFADLVKVNVLNAGLRKGICGNCQWNDICEALEGK